MKFKLYKNFFITLMFMFIVILISFYQYMNSYFPKQAFLDYEHYRDNCHDSYDDPICAKYGIVDEESYNLAIENNIIEQRKEIDAKYLCFTVIEHYLFYYVSLFLPLIIAILVCLMISKDVNTGFYQHILMRKRYKNYLFEKTKSVLLISFVYPISIFMIFILSLFLTNFNLSNSHFLEGLSIYSSLKSQHFFLSIFIIMLLTFILSLIYGIISASVAVKEKSPVVAITKSFLICVSLNIIDYFIGNMVLYKMLNIELFGVSTLNFDVLNYFILSRELSLPLVFVNLFILLLVSSIYFLIKFGRKENFYGTIERESTII